MIGQVMKAIEDSDSRKGLVDMRELHFDVPMIHLYERARGVRNQRLNSKITSRKVALVYTAWTRKIDEDLNFIEMAARNRNLPYRVFKDLEEAQKWLREP